MGRKLSFNFAYGRNNFSFKILSVLWSDLFWMRQILLRFVDDFFGGDFENNGVSVYEEHYRELEKKLREAERNYLKWTVKDGWYVSGPHACALHSQTCKLT